MVQRLPVFKTFQVRDLLILFEAFEPKGFRQNKFLFNEGDVSKQLYFLIDGHVEILMGKQAIATLGPGRFLGEMSLITDRRHSARARALKRCFVLVCDRQAYRNLSRRLSAFEKLLNENAPARHPKLHGRK